MVPSNNQIRTAKHKGFIALMAIVLVVSLAFLIWFSLNDELLVIKITVFVMCGIFFVLSIVMLLHMTLDYLVFDENDRVTYHKVFSKSRIKVKDLDCYENKDGLITLKYKGKVFGSFDTGDPNYNKIMHILEKNKVKTK